MANSRWRNLLCPKCHQWPRTSNNREPGTVSIQNVNIKMQTLVEDWKANAKRRPDRNVAFLHSLKMHNERAADRAAYQVRQEAVLHHRQHSICQLPGNPTQSNHSALSISACAWSLYLTNPPGMIF
jgi:hypothetical protein